jgi:CBS domain-containing protein
LDLSLPVREFFQLSDLSHKAFQGRVFHEHILVNDAVRAMNEINLHWILVHRTNGSYHYFDYMDFNHKLMTLTRGATGSAGLIDIVAHMSSMPIGALANCSGYSCFRSISGEAPLSEFLHLALSNSNRIAIVDSNNEVVTAVSHNDFLEVAVKYAGVRAVLKSRDARALDRRSKILDVSVPHDASMLHALHLMDSKGLPVSLATSRELSGDLGGAAPLGVVSVADLRFVFGESQLNVLDRSVSDFITWRANAEASTSERQRFNVISVDSNETLHVLASRLVSSKSRRIFLSSDEIGRIVGIVSAWDIFVEIYDRLIQSCVLGERIRASS